MASAEAWELHGFGDVSVKKDYVTPRGLVVTTDGAMVHLVNGLSVNSPSGVSIYAGTFLALNPGHATGGEPLNEFDWWVGASVPVAEGLTASIEYGHWIFPDTIPYDERNIQFTLKYADKPKNGFSINPHANIFWSVNSKSSTVVLGKPDGTGYFELGVTPTYAGKGFTLTAPTWMSIGPKEYWVSEGNKALVATLVNGGDRSNLGVFSTGLKASVPLSLGGKAGASVYAFGQYYHMFNDGLVASKQLLNNGDQRNHFNFGVGMGWGF
ncbi:hypothetical protein [Rhizorhabdus argentea]|uniref:hypothetical protein n=1 Tax=Rhizorhabdus argentea TaxID=1387174 RepID=UPI0030EBDE27